MAGSSLFLLIDDIATLLDDVAVMTKVAAKKTAGVLGDDLALNAEQVAGVRAERELPVVWAVAKGSTLNKIILVPAALAISAFVPWLVVPLLMIGGAYLCYEGVEKLAHKFLHSPQEDLAHHKEIVEANANTAVDLVAFEKDKIKGAIRTDFVLSAEIIVIALGTVAAQPLMKQFGVLAAVAAIMTVGVYGFVALIVKLDDIGLHMMKAKGAMQRSVGRGLIAFAPKLMKFLSVAGTIAMFLVGGGILMHGIGPLHQALAAWVAPMGGITGALVENLANALLGVAAGAVVLGVVTLCAKAFSSKQAATERS
jgi:predicted DNA repair protein MutK